MFFLSSGCKRVLSLQVIDIPLEIFELFLGWYATGVSSEGERSDHVFFVLNDLPKEGVSEVLLESGVDMWTVRESLVLDPADQSILEE